MAPDGEQLVDASSPRPRRVLIVDDNVPLAENVAEILEIEGFVVQVAADAEEALSKAMGARLDVVVTDYRLPGMNGAELLHQLRGLGLRVQAIVISAYTDERTVEEARHAGATFVAKPLDFSLLGRVIRNQE